MPIYEYSCKDCGNISEFIVKAGENGQTLSCKKCGGLNLKKILSVSNIATTVSGPVTCVLRGLSNCNCATSSHYRYANFFALFEAPGGACDERRPMRLRLRR